MTKENRSHVKDMVFAVMTIGFAATLSAFNDLRQENKHLRAMFHKTPNVEYQVAYIHTGTNNTKQIYCYLPNGIMAFSNEVPHIVYLTPHESVEH